MWNTLCNTYTYLLFPEELIIPHHGMSITQNQRQLFVNIRCDCLTEVIHCSIIKYRFTSNKKAK